jgi:hypothetical protein
VNQFFIGEPLQAGSTKHSQWLLGVDTNLVPALNPREGALADDIYIGKTQGHKSLLFSSWHVLV